jgi:putative phage-type endonuclease
MYKVIKLKQNTPEWLAFRKMKIGASMAPVIMCVSPYQTPLQLYTQIVDDVRNEDTPSMQYGREKEEEARAMACKEIGREFEPCVLQHGEYDWLIASLDGFDGVSPLEIKTVNRDDWELIKAGKIPEKHYPQVQMQIEIAKAPIGYYCAYFQGKKVVFSVDRDTKYIRTMMAAVHEFWRRVCELDPPPALDRDIPEVHDPAAVDCAKEYARLMRQKEVIDAKLEELRNSLIACAPTGTARIGELLISRTDRQGPIDYKAIPELQGVNLDLYRKNIIAVWKITHD